MFVQYVDAGDDEVLATISHERYHQLLASPHRRRMLAIHLDEALTVVTTKPTEAQWNAGEVFVSYADIVAGRQTNESLLESLRQQMSRTNNTP